MSGTPDNGTRYVILGALAMLAEQMRRFIQVKYIRTVYDSDGIVEAFTITTYSGRRYRVTVEQLEDERLPLDDAL